jgi:hypothetical protein
MKSLLQKIDFRFILRFITIALLGMQIALVIIFFEANQMKEASTAFALATWMTLALFFETKAYNLKTEKKNLEDFLSNPESKGEMD